MERRIAMVLNDGETYTGIVGCKIVEIPPEVDPSEESEFVRDAVRNESPSLTGEFVSDESGIRLVTYLTVGSERGVAYETDIS